MGKCVKINAGESFTVALMGNAKLNLYHGRAQMTTSTGGFRNNLFGAENDVLPEI